MKKSPEQIVNELRQLQRDLPLLVGNETVNFALDNWDKQGFQGAFFQAWEERKDDRSTRAILVGKQSGRLRRSNRVINANERTVEVGSELDYAGIHNEGGTIKVSVTAKSRKFFWAMYYKTGLDKWKGMAMTRKKTLTITIPQRRFIGDSPELDRRVRELIEARLKRIFG